MGLEVRKLHAVYLLLEGGDQYPTLCTDPDDANAVACKSVGRAVVQEVVAVMLDDGRALVLGPVDSALKVRQ